MSDDRTMHVPTWITNVTPQGEADRLLEKIWRARAEMRQRKARCLWIDSDSEPGAWARELKARGVQS